MNEVETMTFRLWIAGDYADAIRTCRQFCETEGACFSVSPCAYVYTGGMEDGAVITLINYPRFPSTHDELEEKMGRLAEHMRAKLFQKSYTIEGPRRSAWTTTVQE